MRERSEDLLAAALDDLRGGRTTLEAWLDRHPARRTALEPLLRTALAVAPPETQPRPDFVRRSRAELVGALRRRRRRATWPGHLARALFTALGGLTLAAAVGVGTTCAAQDPLPGDVLYPLKITSEQVGLRLGAGGADPATAHLALAERRLTELERADALGRTESVRLAAMAYARQMELAGSARAAPAAAAGRRAIAERLQATLSRQETLRRALAPRAPEAARALERGARAGRGLAAALSPPAAREAPTGTMPTFHSLTLPAITAPIPVLPSAVPPAEDGPPTALPPTPPIPQLPAALSRPVAELPRPVAEPRPASGHPPTAPSEPPGARPAARRKRRRGRANRSPRPPHRPRAGLE